MRNKMIVLLSIVLAVITTASNYLMDKKLQKISAEKTEMHNQLLRLQDAKQTLDVNWQNAFEQFTAERDQEISRLKNIIAKQADFNGAQADAAIATINDWKEKIKVLKLELSGLVVKNNSLKKKLQVQEKIIVKYDIILTSYKKEKELTRITAARSASDKLFHATLLAWNEYRMYKPFQVDMVDKKILKMLIVNPYFRNLSLYQYVWDTEAKHYFQNKYGVFFYNDPINAEDYVNWALKDFEKCLTNNQQVQAGKIADELEAIFQNDDKLWEDFQPRLKSIKVGHGNLYDYLLSDYTTPSEIPAGIYFQNNNPWRVTQGN